MGGIWAAMAFLPFTSSAQISITSGIQKYGALTNTTVTMTGRCELWVTNASAPLIGCAINLNSTDAWLFITGVKPSFVASTYLGQVRVNGSLAVANSNVRVVQYGQNGAVVIPYSSSFRPLTVYSGPNFVGASAQYAPYTYYSGSGLGAMDLNIRSFRLKRGYMAVLAQNTDGSGVSKSYIAQDGDVEIGALPSILSGKARFIYVTLWRWTSKKGIACNPGLSRINSLWWYDWNIDQNSSSDLEYVAIRQNSSWPPIGGQNWLSPNINTLLGFNEPDSSSQANMSVSSALAEWPLLLSSGLRVGSPAVTDGGRGGWLYPFMSQADSNGLRVDFVAIHYYQSHNPADPSGCASQMYNFLLDVWNHTRRPIWITEWNNGANWTDSQWPVPTYAQQQACISAMINMLESTPFVERYALYNWVEDGRSLVTSSNTVTPAGLTYSNLVSGTSYSQTIPGGGSRGVAQFLFEGNTWDASGYGNNAMSVGAPMFTNGSHGQAIALDGVNSYLQLPAAIAGSNAFTFAAWVHWNGGANWQRIFDFGNDTSHYLFLTPNSGNNTLRFAINNGSGEQIIETRPLASGQWQHVAITLSGGTAKLYTNGVLAASSSSFTLAPASVQPVKDYLGKSQFALDPLFNGFLDDVQIADSALSPAQIASLMTNLPPQFTTNFIDCGAAAPFLMFSTNITATDPNPGSTLTYVKANGPSWLNVSAGGTISGTPGSVDGGTNYFTVRAVDSAGESAFTEVAIYVPITYGNGVWIMDGDGSWDDTLNWGGGTIANGGNGANCTADFSTLNITADLTVTLNSARTIGALKFGDTTGSQNWILESSGPSLALDSGSTLMPSIVVNQNATTISAQLSGTNGFTKSGAGTLVLAANNSISGTFNVDSGQASSGNDGVVRITFPGAIGNFSSIAIRNQNSAASSLQLDGSNGSISSSAPLALNGRNNSVVAIENLAGSNTLSGGISINVGGSSYLLQSDAGGLLNLGGAITSVATGARQFTFQGNGDFNVTGPIRNGSATVGIEKTGSGKLTLGGANNYSGATILSGGALFVHSMIGPGAVTVASGCTLGGSGIINSSIAMPAGTTLMPGEGLSTLTVNGNVTLQPGSTLRIQLNKSLAANDELLVAGTLSLGGALVVTNTGGYLTDGDTFTVFSASAINGNLASVTLPSLGAGLAWDTNRLASGMISVVATSAPQFTAVNQNGDGTFRFSGTGAAGVTYELNAATNLAPPIHWILVTNTVADQTGAFDLWDLSATNFQQRFYQVKSMP